MAAGRERRFHWQKKRLVAATAYACSAPAGKAAPGLTSGRTDILPGGTDSRAGEPSARTGTMIPAGSESGCLDAPGGRENPRGGDQTAAWRTGNVQKDTGLDNHGLQRGRRIAVQPAWEATCLGTS